MSGEEISAGLTGMVHEGDESKQCPDCAERVLAAARKCRYCGYRFDAGRRQRGSVLAGLIPGLVRSSRDATMPEILADWGVRLGAHEKVVFFRLATFDEEPGYLLVTSERLIFFGEISRREHVKSVEYTLSSLSGVHVAGGRTRPHLRLGTPDGEHVVQGIIAADTRWLDVFLVEHSVAITSSEQ